MTCFCGSCPTHDDHPLAWILMEPQLGNLQTTEHDDIPIHAIPGSDTHKHLVDLDGQCGCNPWIDDEADDLIWVHNAFDGREAFARGFRKPS